MLGVFGATCLNLQYSSLNCDVVMLSGLLSGCPSSTPKTLEEYERN